MNIAELTLAELRQRLHHQPPAERWARRSEYQRGVALYRAGLNPSRKSDPWSAFSDKEQADLLAVGEAWL